VGVLAVHTWVRILVRDRCRVGASPWQRSEGGDQEVAALSEGGDHSCHGLAAAAAQRQRRQRRVLRYAAGACVARKRAPEPSPRHVLRPSSMSQLSTDSE